MKNILVICFDLFGDHNDEYNSYPSAVRKIISRAVFHESLTVEDAEHYLLAKWPDIICLVDPFIAENTPQSNYLLSLVCERTWKGCTTIFTGCFAPAVNGPRLDNIFLSQFDLPWLVSEIGRQEVRLCMKDGPMMRTASVRKRWVAEALFLRNVPPSHIVVAGRKEENDEICAFATFAKVGLGKLGYIGDLDLTPESERVFISMCGLDIAEEALGPEPGGRSISVFDDDDDDEEL